MKTVTDECWMCGKEIKKGDEYVDVELRRMMKGDRCLVHRACLKCAKKNRMLLKSSYDVLVEDGMWKVKQMEESKDSKEIIKQSAIDYYEDCSVEDIIDSLPDEFKRVAALRHVKSILQCVESDEKDENLLCIVREAIKVMDALLGME